MRAEHAWNGALAIVLVIGIAADGVWLGWAWAIQAFALVTFAFWVFALCLLDDVASRGRTLTKWSLVVSLASVAFVGLWALVQGWAVVVALAFLAGHPRVVSWLRHNGAADADVASEASGPAGTGKPTAKRAAAKAAAFGRPRGLSDHALRQAWAASWALLLGAKSLDEAVRIVKYREACLDDFARRSPEVFQLWLEAGAADVEEPARQLPTTFRAESSS